MGEPLRFPVPAGPGPNRGRLMTPKELASMIGGVSEAWVRRTVPHKLELGHSTVRWFEEDVRAWLEELRGATSAGALVGR